MNDGVSLVFYTVKLDVDSDFHKQPKIMRQMFHYGNGVLLQSRLYPCNDNHLARNKFLEIVQEIFTDCLDNRLGWARIGDWYQVQKCYVKVGKMSLHYEDYNIYDNNIVASLNLDVYGKFDKYGNLATCPSGRRAVCDFVKPLEIGGWKVYCIECG